MILILLLFVSLFLILILYLRIAARYGISDNPNERSSHKDVTVRGGGIIFWFTGMAYFIYYFPEQSLFFTGFTIIAIGSFIDDIRHLNQWIRFILHAVGVTIAFIALKVFGIWPWYLMVTAYILYIGVLNAYNFMDGINGMTGLYSISMLFVLQYINIYKVSFVEPNFIWFPVIASLIFLFFNFRKHAVCFAGDVGSITIAFWILYLLMLLIIKTSSIGWILLLAVYGTDSVMTILHRLWLRQNIFHAHRMHFYQVLANECSLDHRIVSTLYAAVQVVVSIMVIRFWNIWPLLLLSILVLVPLVLLYCIKFRIIKKEVIGV